MLVTTNHVCYRQKLINLRQHGAFDEQVQASRRNRAGDGHERCSQHGVGTVQEPAEDVDAGDVLSQVSAEDVNTRKDVIAVLPEVTDIDVVYVPMSSEDIDAAEVVIPVPTRT